MGDAHVGHMGALTAPRGHCIVSKDGELRPVVFQVTWVETEDTYKIVAINFRYAKIKINVNSSNSGILAIRKVTVRLDAKLKTAQGTVPAIATDAGGTVVDISSEEFIDIRSIVLTPMSTTPVYAVYDFVDIPNPTQFKVFIFDTTGVRISGTVSWNIRGVV